MLILLNCLIAVLFSVLGESSASSHFLALHFITIYQMVYGYFFWSMFEDWVERISTTAAYYLDQESAIQAVNKENYIMDSEYFSIMISCCETVIF